MTHEMKTEINTPEKMVAAVDAMKISNPANRMARYFPSEYFLNLPKEKQDHVKRIVIAGLMNDDSKVGAYAMETSDYDNYGPVLDPIIRDYHTINADFRFKADWDISNKKLNLKDIDTKLAEISMRVRVARNVEGFPLTGNMTQEDRVRFENYMIEKVFSNLIANLNYRGRYVSLTPGSKYEISPDEYQKLVDNHQMFKDMSADSHLEAAGISGDWPYGRGMYISEDQQKIVWVGEEDQLRIMNMQKGSDLAAIFNGLGEELKLIEELGVPFARSEKYGYVTSCPSNLGTGMRASLHLKLPNLTEFGKNVSKLENILAEAGINVSVRGAGGEHTAAGADGLVDISPRGRMIPESEVITQLYDAAAKLLDLEKTSK